MRAFTLGLIQMPVGPDKERNLRRAERDIEQAAGKGAELLVLPEMFNCPYELEQFRPCAESIPEGPTCSMLSEVARRCGIHLVGGSIPELEGERIYNTATLWGPDGVLLGTHRKVHLFDVDIEGGIRFEESRVLSPGNRASLVSTPLAEIGLGLCFDLRFPELFRAEAATGAELIILPGAFNTTTGPAHWEPLLRARAIENTVYFAACSPAPDPNCTYPAWGHSMIVDPFGVILAEAGREAEILCADVDPARLAQVRQGLPVLRQRRRFSGP